MARVEARTLTDTRNVLASFGLEMPLTDMGGVVETLLLLADIEVRKDYWRSVRNMTDIVTRAAAGGSSADWPESLHMSILFVVADSAGRCGPQFEGDFSDYNFGEAAELLFTPCTIPDEEFDELEFETNENSVAA